MKNDQMASAEMENEKPFDILEAIKRLDSKRFERLATMVEGERARREKTGSKAGQMTDADFRKWADEQIRIGEQAEREMDLRTQLSGAKTKEANNG